MSVLRYIVCVAACAVVLCGCERQPDVALTPKECAAMPGGGRACATCFVMDDRAYVFAGRDSAGQYRNDLWRYTPATDTWENLGETPLGARVNACACVRDGKAYVGLGFNGRYVESRSYLRDWWEYEPATNRWTRLADYPNGNTDCATAFSAEGELYVGYGFGNVYTRDMFRYAIAANTWDSIDVGVDYFGYPSRSFGGTGCTCRGRHFMGTGYYRYSLNWWAELLPEGRWVARTAVPGRTRTTAASAASDRYVYLCGGLHYGGVNTTGEVLQDLLRYEPENDRWQWIAVMPEGLFNHVCFALKGKIYWGLGENEDFKTTDKLYCVEE